MLMEWRIGGLLYCRTCVLVDRRTGGLMGWWDQRPSQVIKGAPLPLPNRQLFDFERTPVIQPGGIYTFEAAATQEGVAWRLCVLLFCLLGQHFLSNRVPG